MGWQVADIEGVAAEVSKAIYTGADNEAEDAALVLLGTVSDLRSSDEYPTFRVAAARAESLIRLAHSAENPERYERVVQRLSSVQDACRRELERASDNEAEEAGAAQSKVLAARVLDELAVRGRSRTGVLAERLGVRAPQVSRALRQLTSAGKVREVPSDSLDRRQRWYEVTTSGERRAVSAESAARRRQVAAARAV